MNLLAAPSRRIETTTSPADRSRRSRASLRGLIDVLISLGIAIVLVRGFLVEGYLISTGSMAPHLYGEHKQIVCPSCGTSFAVGTEFDDGDGDHTHAHAVCPNCLYDEIDTAALPVNRGDHLLVWKNAFVWREPRRWEVVVFQNPNRPRETFIKRVAGLPGETLQIRDGNLFINGEIVRKSLGVQRACLLPVFDTARAPTDAEWIPRWTSSVETSGWQWAEPGLEFTPPTDPAEDYSWIDYRHTRRHGGRFITTRTFAEPLSPSQQEAFLPTQGEFPYQPAFRFPGVQYDPDQNTLSCRGVMSSYTFTRLMAVDPTPSYTATIEELAAESHITPIDDFIAYNAISPLRDENAIDECLLGLDLTDWANTTEVAVALRIDADEFHCVIKPGLRTIELRQVGERTPLRVGTFPPPASGALRLEVSSIDRQLLVVVDGVEVIEPLLLEPPAEPRSPSRMPISLGARGGPIRIRRVNLERDTFYTSGQERHGIGEPFQLNADEFFMLGDNSPVSSDSRSWHQAAVPRKLLVGKPFLVHLPSRTTQFAWGDRQMSVRIPDFSRVRFVR